ncbi:MAG: glycosyltransferase family 2 protein [Nitrososphaerota archaeon]|nr:glycosyltransferase family 2 protein [Nitrososphaerota archaeon]
MPVSLAGFELWLHSLTLFELLLILSVPLLIDMPRSVGKSVFLLLDGLHSKIRPKAFDDTYLPKITLIIPAHNEEGTIERSIEAAVDADYPNKEIIVVDDGSTDNTYVRALPYDRRHMIKLVHRETASGSKSGAINFGMLFSTGEILYIIDADTLLERNALRESTKCFSIPSVNAVSGNVRILAGDGGEKNLLTSLQSYEYLLSLEMGRRFNALMGTLLIIPGAFGGFRRKAGEELGFFDRDTLTEDFDFTLKLRKLKGKIFFVPTGISWTFCPASWKSWFRQRRRWAYGQMETLGKHKDAFVNLRYGKGFLLALYDMVLMDMILLCLRTAWLAFTLLTYTGFILYPAFLVFGVYLVSEAVVVLTAGVLSPRRGDLRLIYVLPLMVLFYRPLYGMVRLEAYVRWLLGKKSAW